MESKIYHLVKPVYQMIIFYGGLEDGRPLILFIVDW